MMNTNYHDKSYKELLINGKRFADFLRLFIKKPWVNMIEEGSLVACDKGFVDPFFEEIESDIIFRGKIKGKDVYFFILLELQSSIDYTMPFRISYYMAAIRRRLFKDMPENERRRKGFKLPSIVPIVFYNGKDNWLVTENFAEYHHMSELFGSFDSFNYILVDVNKLDHEALLKEATAVANVVAVDAVRDGNLAEIIVRSGQTLRRLPDEYDAFKAWVHHTIQYRTGSKIAAQTVIDALEKGDDKMLTTGIGFMIDEAEARGEAEGIAKTIVDVAKRLLRSKTPLEVIVEATNLTEEEIIRLRDEMAEDK